MSKPAAVFCLLCAACAAGGVAVDREAGPHVVPRLEMTAAAETVRVFPAAQDPRLPTADRLSRRIRAELGEVASADVRLCVAPDGRVQRIDLVRGSSLAEFDQAVMHDIADWQFSGFPGTSSTVNLRNCEIVTIRYRPHS